MIRRGVMLVLGGALALAACSQTVKAPTTPRTCYYAVQQKDKSWEFFKVAENQKAIENCAVELERMRLRFLRLGGSNNEIVGTYQGQFIFLQNKGVFFSRQLNGVRYLALRRYNGNLVMPGAIQEPPEAQAR